MTPLQALAIVLNAAFDVALLMTLVVLWCRLDDATQERDQLRGVLRGVLRHRARFASGVN